MKKQTLKLKESQLRDIIKESILNCLNEKYGSVSQSDREDFDKIDDPGSWEEPEVGVYDIEMFKTAFTTIRYHLNTIHTALHKMFKPQFFHTEFNKYNDEVKDNKYAKAILQHIDKAYRILNLWANQELQKTGQQPDLGYHNLPTGQVISKHWENTWNKD